MLEVETLYIGSKLRNSPTVLGVWRTCSAFDTDLVPLLQTVVLWGC